MMIKKIVTTTILLPIRAPRKPTDQGEEKVEAVVVKVVVTATRRAAKMSPTKTIELEIDPDEELEQLRVNLLYL
jgi:hypothetical protein